MQEEQNSGKPYLVVVIFLIALVLVGAVVLVFGKSTVSQSLQNTSPSANIEVSPAPITASSSAQMEKVSQLQIEDKIVGTGEEAVAGKAVTVNYVGTLTDGTKFDSSYDRNEPFTFNLGAGEVIQGWDQGVSGMKVGGKRKLTIPSSLAYGDNGISGVIPGGATLIFEVELLKVE